MVTLAGSAAPTFLERSPPPDWPPPSEWFGEPDLVVVPADEQGEDDCDRKGKRNLLRGSLWRAQLARWGLSLATFTPDDSAIRETIFSDLDVVGGGGGVGTSSGVSAPHSAPLSSMLGRGRVRPLGPCLRGRWSAGRDSVGPSCPLPDGQCWSLADTGMGHYSPSSGHTGVGGEGERMERVPSVV